MRLARDLDEILARTQGMWDELRGGCIFVTGGTGFFGSWIVESFLWANEKLGLDAHAVLLTRNPTAFLRRMPRLKEQSAIEFCVGDVRSFEFPDGKFSHLIHGASVFNPGAMQTNPNSEVDTTIEGTRRVLDFARQLKIRKLLFISSGAVYGRQPPGMPHLSEDFGNSGDIINWRSDYGDAKRAAELQCVLQSREDGLECKVARCFTFVGPYLRLDSGYAIGSFIRDALAGVPIQISGDGTPWRSYLYAGDLVTWLWTILFKGQSCRPYNVGSDEALTIQQVANEVAKVTGGRLNVTVAMKPVEGAVAGRYVPCVDRARNELGLGIWTSLAEAIQRTLEFNKNA